MQGLAFSRGRSKTLQSAKVSPHWSLSSRGDSFLLGRAAEGRKAQSRRHPGLAKALPGGQCMGPSEYRQRSREIRQDLVKTQARARF